MDMLASKQAAVGSDVNFESRSCRTPAFLLPSLICLPPYFFSCPLLFFYLAMPSKKSRNTANMSIDDDKRSLDVHDAPIGINDKVDEKKGTAADRADMYRMGKTQEMTARTQYLYPFVLG
jgi:hypothetical protein